MNNVDSVTRQIEEYKYQVRSLRIRLGLLRKDSNMDKANAIKNKIDILNIKISDSQGALHKLKQGLIPKKTPYNSGATWVRRMVGNE